MDWTCRLVFDWIIKRTSRITMLCWLVHSQAWVQKGASAVKSWMGWKHYLHRYEHYKDWILFSIVMICVEERHTAFNEEKSFLTTTECKPQQWQPSFETNPSWRKCLGEPAGDGLDCLRVRWPQLHATRVGIFKCTSLCPRKACLCCFGEWHYKACKI